MPEPASTAAPPAPVSREALRLVLFGRPGAGKTSLLGALSQAAQTQEHLLHGRLTEPEPALAAVRQQVYDETTRPTAEEVVLYPVEFEFFDPEGRTPGGQRQQAVLIDCDGKAANDLLMRRQTLSPDSAERPLAQEVLAAETLVLVVDASEPAGQIEADFVEFGRFLRLFERGRGQRSEVGGLPVFLVLSKCDLLAQPGDAPVDWVERIEERKRQVGQRFREFLAAKDEDDGPLPFGQIDLHLWATAVKRPALAGNPARPREPYGVAELFRQCLEEARLFHQRRRQSGRRLLWTVAGATGLVALLIAVTAALFSQALKDRGRDDQAVLDLQNKIDSYRLSEGQTTAERLKGTLTPLRQRIGALAEMRDDPAFGRLPAKTREYVQERLHELQDYAAYYDKLLHLRRQPAAAGTENELDEIEQTLKTDLAVPRPAWGPTPAAQLHDDYLTQIQALRKAVDDVTEWYRQRRSEGEKLWTFQDRQPGVAGTSVDWPAWHADVERLLAQAEKPPFRKSDQLPGPGAPTYGETVFHFRPVREARHEWEAMKEKLERVRDLSAALGLGGPGLNRPATLVIPRKPPFTVADARARLRELERDYPEYDKKNWFTLQNLPEAIAGDIRQAAAANYEPLLEAGREVVHQRLQQAGKGDQETAPRWQAVREWLKNPEELQAWRVLATVLGRLKDPEAGDPVSELAAFLARDRFELDLKRLTLEIPFARDVRPVGPLSIYHPATNKTAPALVFELAGDMQRDPQRRVTTYTFRPLDGKGTLIYRPGDELWATLPLKDDLVFTWARSRSEVYQHERLTSPPRLHRKDQENVAGELAQGVVLSVTQGRGIPPVPALMPVVRLEKR